MGRILTPTGASGVLEESARVEILNPFPNDATKFLDGTGAFTTPASTGTVTNTGTLTSGKLIQGNGGVDVIVNATTATVTKLTSGTPSAASAGTDYVAPGAVTTSGLTQSTAKLLGRTTASTGAIEEITVGANLTFSAGTLSASASGGNVTTSATLTSGKTIIGNGSVDINVSSLTATVVKSSSGTLAAATDGTDYLSPSTGWTKLSQIVTSGSQATVDFTSISGSYSTLKVLIYAQDTTNDTSDSAIYLKINNDGTSGNYTSTQRGGAANGAAVINTSAATANGSQAGLAPNAGTTGAVGNTEVTITGYASTAFHKVVVYTGGDNTTTNAGSIQIGTFRWKSTSTITRLTFTAGGTAFTNGSIFTLYGLP